MQPGIKRGADKGALRHPPNALRVSNSPETLPKQYDHASVEKRRYAEAEAAGVFHEEPDPARPPFIIAMPPPNITGRAHLGHASTYSAMDVLTRYRRMLGENATWLPGQDHAAIATEAVIVRDLAAQGTTRDELGREKFLETAWEWRAKYGGIINDQFRLLGFGADWQRERFTMDAGLSAAVNRAFVELHKQGLIYRGRRLVNWDPKAQSTLSDAEVEHEERQGSLWHIRYRAEDGGEGVVVATTRPETMLGDTAIAVHPEDARYAGLIGKRVMLPLINRAIPVIADSAIDREFGTGAVKITPAHDPLDYEIGLRHDLRMPSILNAQAVIESDAPEITGDLAPFAGLDRFDARKAIVEALQAAGALEKIEPHTLNVSISSRSHAVVEPLLSLQWFCKMQPLAEPALQAYRDGKFRFIAARNGKTYEQWLENIRDWNISRQVWWGHRLPVWYTPDDEVIVAESEIEAKEIAAAQYGSPDIRQDNDTLDTWFSSGLWPFSILGWPDKTPELEHWYPTQVLVTAREIIFLWVARMVMLGLHFVGEVPFHDVLITPLVFDEHGRKMSKSLGNAIDPLDLIERYGADATRFGILRQMHIDSQELRFAESRCAEAARFNNKIWNALLYTHSIPGGIPEPAPLRFERLSIADRWMLTELRATVQKISDALDAYDFSEYAETFLHFTWYRFCDWYIEANKRPSESRAEIMSFALSNLMRLMHPIAPFISEEVWQALPHDGETIVTASWPDIQEIPHDAQAHALFEAIIAKVTDARGVRADAGLKPNEKLELAVPRALEGAFDGEIVWLLASLCGAKIQYVANPPVHEAGENLYVATIALIQAAAPRADAKLMLEKLAKKIEKLESEVERGRKKLANENFTGKAAPEAVAAEREKLAAYEAELAQARESMSAYAS